MSADVFTRVHVYMFTCVHVYMCRVRGLFHVLLVQEVPASFLLLSCFFPASFLLLSCFFVVSCIYPLMCTRAVCAAGATSVSATVLLGAPHAGTRYEDYAAQANAL